MLFTVLRAREEYIAVQAFNTMEHRVLLEGTSARYVPTGHLLFARENTLWIVPFDVENLETTGPASPVLEDVYVTRRGAGQFSLSAHGSLVYLPGDVNTRAAATIVWVDREGRETPLVEEADNYGYPRLSPDRSQLAVAISEDVWTIDLARGSRSRLTRGRESGFVAQPTWTADGQAVTFVAVAAPDSIDRALFSVPADASQDPHRLLVRPNDLLATAWSPDGETLAYYEATPDAFRDLWTLTPSESEEPSPFLTTASNERAAAFSPDGHWLVYVSDASGQDEVCVRPYPREAGGQVTISTSGGTEPVWSPTGSEVFYRTGTELMAVDVDLGPPIVIGRPHVLFEDVYVRDTSGALALPFYDVDTDGERFVMVLPGEREAEEDTFNGLILVQNWFEELKERVPTN